MRKLLVQFDGGGAADAPSLQDLDCLVGGLAACRVLIEGGVGFGLEHLEVTTRLEWSFFNDDHIEAGCREEFGGDTAAGATADNDDVGFICLVGGESGCVNMFPA